MRASFLTPYNRAAARSLIRGSSQLGHSQLANLAVQESRWIISFLEWSGGSENVYDPKPESAKTN